MTDEEKLLARQLGQNIRTERSRKRYSQQRLAELCSLHRTAINNIEKGQRLPHVITILKIKSVLEISADELLRGAPVWVAGGDGEWLLASQRRTNVPA